MPAAFETGINLGEVVDDLGDVERDIQQFRHLLRQEIDSAVRKTAKEFIDEVKKQIKKSGIEEDTGELLNSWYVRPNGIAEYEVRSTAEHAVYLELGTRAHTITGNPWLKFMPENPSAYPTRDFQQDENGNVSGNFFEDGIVRSPMDPLFDPNSAGTYVAQSVRHPGTKTYGYFQAAIDAKQWRTTLNNRVLQGARRAAREAGLDL